MGAVSVAVFVHIIHRQVFPPFHDPAGITQTPDFEQFSVQMQDLAAAGPFVEIVYVLGDDMYVEIIFQFCQEFVSGIGMHCEQLSSPLIVKIVYQVGVDSKSLGRSHFIDVMSFPQAIGIPECFDPAFGADTGAGEYDEFLFHNYKFRKINLPRRHKGTKLDKKYSHKSRKARKPTKGAAAINDYIMLLIHLFYFVRTSLGTPKLLLR